MSQIIRLSWPKTSPKYGMSRMNSGSTTSGMRSMSDGVPCVP